MPCTVIRFQDCSPGVLRAPTTVLCRGRDPSELPYPQLLRLIGSIEREVLDRMLIINAMHLRPVLAGLGSGLRLSPRAQLANWRCCSDEVKRLTEPG